MKLPVYAAAIAIALPLAAHADYVPGMTCEEVGFYAEAVASKKRSGETMQEQIIQNRQELSRAYSATMHAEEQIIKAIYQIKALSEATPEAVHAAYERTCRSQPGFDSDNDEQMRLRHSLDVMGVR
jgi:hypothetical protein